MFSPTGTSASRTFVRYSPTIYSGYGRSFWRTCRFYSTRRPSDNSFRTSRARWASRVNLSERIGLATYPYYDPELMSLLQTHLPAWNGFRTRYLTYLIGQWNSIYGDWDYSPESSELVVEEEQPLLQRDRLMQIFEACPVGSYGFFAAKGLTPFKRVVGSYAAATIDEFFATQVPWLKQPYCDDLNKLMSELETRYWNNRKELRTWLAGKTFTKRMRQWGVSRIAVVWDGKEGPVIPRGEPLAEKQITEAREVVEGAATDLDDEALEQFSHKLYDDLVKKGKAARE